MHIVTRMVSVIAMCCFAMTTVVAADREKKLLMSKQMICGQEVEVYKFDIADIEYLAPGGAFNSLIVKGFHKTLYQVFDGEKPIGSDLYALTFGRSYSYPSSRGMGRYYLEPAINGSVEKEYGPGNLYVETFSVDAIEKWALGNGRVIGTAIDGSTKLHVLWRIGKPHLFSEIEAPVTTMIETPDEEPFPVTTTITKKPKKPSACEIIMAGFFKLFMSKQ